MRNQFTIFLPMYSLLTANSAHTSERVNENGMEMCTKDSKYVYFSHLSLKSNTEVASSSLVQILNKTLTTTGVLLSLLHCLKNVSDIILSLLYWVSLHLFYPCIMRQFSRFLRVAQLLFYLA